jgi:hypothetical protein
MYWCTCCHLLSLLLQVLHWCIHSCSWDSLGIIAEHREPCMSIMPQRTSPSISALLLVVQQSALWLRMLAHTLAELSGSMLAM